MRIRRRLLAAFSGFTNVVLAALCSKELTLLLFGGRLLSLIKKSGLLRGVRPTVVGVTLRRLASKCANTHGAARMAPLFGHRQLGVRIPRDVRQPSTPRAVT